VSSLSNSHADYGIAMSVLEGKELRVERGGNLILDIKKISLNEGEILSLVGPNGAGKSTLLSTLCMLTGNFNGHVFFNGKDIGDEISQGEYRKRIAMVFQEPLLFNTTVFENVASGLKFRKIKKPEIKRIVEENLNRFGIVHLKNRSIKNISGGEAQRVSLARAFAVNPEILFLDEPFSALDPPTREALLNDFEEILCKSRTTTVFATHDRIEAIRLSDRIAVMDKGSIVQTGRPDEVINHPANEFVASFIGVETILKGSVTDRINELISVDVSGYKIDAIGDYRKGENVILCIRPENVTVSVNHSAVRSSARNSFQGKIEKITRLGLFYRIDIDCGFSIVAYVTGSSIEEISLTSGKEVEVSFKATAVHVLKGKS
jgi:tungstate transport system ATP-binding protein